MDKVPLAFHGCDYRGARSFVVTCTAATSTAEITLAEGGYIFQASADTDVTIAPAGQGAATGLTTTTTQPAQNSTLRIFANGTRAIDVAAGCTLRAYSTPGSSLVIIGPIRAGTHF